MAQDETDTLMDNRKLIMDNERYSLAGRTPSFFILHYPFSIINYSFWSSQP
jgi:hypothetical protein